MEQDREKIEQTVRKCTDRLGFVTEEQVQSMVERLTKMNDIKSVVDSLALNIEKFFGREEQKADFEASMQDILELSGGAYSSVDEIIAQVQNNKAQNYTPRKYISRR
jgi:uncharacterized protein YlbG (UPF0298 family)